MIEEGVSNSIILDIVQPSLTFPEIKLEKGNSLGLYTTETELMTSYFFKLISEPEKYAKEVKINGFLANGMNWVGRSFTHIVVPQIWKDSIYNILKNKPKRRHLIFIGARKCDINYAELSEISTIISYYKKDCSILVVSDSVELLQATTDRVVNMLGESIVYGSKEFFN
ncbi:MAG TPA: hypothetical protein DEA49_06850 [Petrotoga sp.]|nr:MAG: Uncharacterized protein XD53_0039 [Petrotoga mobilis]HBT51811.1 hypothetical protein [Petrotoga sp.]